MPGAIETRLAQLERLVTRRENPGAEVEQQRREELAAAEAAFDAVDAQRSELRDQHGALLAQIRAAVSGTRKSLAALHAIEQADYPPYMAQVNACQRGAQRQRRVELGGSHSLIELVDRVELLVRELEASR